MGIWYHIEVKHVLDVFWSLGYDNGSNNKSKPRLNMTMKGPSCKQVIVLMNNELGKRFIKDSVFHITNINHALKNIKSSVCADFIYADNKGIIISTNNIASNSDLQEIEKYIKNSLQTSKNNIASPQLLQSKSYLKMVITLKKSLTDNST